MSEAPDRTGGAQRPAGPSTEEIAALDAHWRAANYLAVGQIYLMDNPLLDRAAAPRAHQAAAARATGAPRRA